MKEKQLITFSEGIFSPVEAKEILVDQLSPNTPFHLLTNFGFVERFGKLLEGTQKI